MKRFDIHVVSESEEVAKSLSLLFSVLVSAKRAFLIIWKSISYFYPDDSYITNINIAIR